MARRGAAAAVLAAHAAGSAADDAGFAAFNARFGRAYASGAEEARRLAAFTRNVARVAAAGNPALGVTRFMDMEPEEFAATYLHRRSAEEAEEDRRAVAALKRWGGECRTCALFPEMGNYTAESLDWTTKGAVTPVKDQANCDSCYCFGATGDMEASWFMAGNKLVSLSEQEVLSCVGEYNGTKKGCQGGTRSKVFSWVIDHGGITTEANYPYTAKTGTCQTSREKPVAAHFDSYEVVSSDATGEGKLMEALQKLGPISVGVSASHMEFYDSGVDDPSSCNTVHDHAPLLVGYGTTPQGLDYWKLKNSWGRGWGEKGYIRAVRGKNWCGIATEVLHTKVGGGKRYHCGLDGTCAEADEGHATMKDCTDTCVPHKPEQGYECVIDFFGNPECQATKHGAFDTHSACEAKCGHVTPAPGPPPPRYHCDNTTYRCTAGASGHGTIEKCETACLAPGYVCNTTSSLCYGVPTAGDKKHVCESQCVYPTPAPPPPTPAPPPPPPPPCPGGKADCGGNCCGSGPFGDQTCCRSKTDPAKAQCIDSGGFDACCADGHVCQQMEVCCGAACCQFMQTCTLGKCR